MDPHIQDWKPHVLRKNTTKQTEKKPTVTHSASVTKVTYDDDGNEIIKLKTVSLKMAQFIMKARIDKGLKQIDLAKQTSIDVKTIGEIERGGCIYKAEQINKIGRVLGVKIPRN